VVQCACVATSKQTVMHGLTPSSSGKICNEHLQEMYGKILQNYNIVLGRKLEMQCSSPAMHSSTINGSLHSDLPAQM